MKFSILEIPPYLTIVRDPFCKTFLSWNVWKGDFGRINNVYRVSLYVIMPHGQYISHKKAGCVTTWTSLLITCWMVKNLPFDCWLQRFYHVLSYADVTICQRFLHYWLYVRGTHRSPVYSPYKTGAKPLTKLQWNLNSKTKLPLVEKHLKMFSVKWRSSCPGDNELNVNYLRLHVRWSVLAPRPMWFLGLDSLCICLPWLSLLHPQIHGNKDKNGDEIFNPCNATISDYSSRSILQNVFIMECLEVIYSQGSSIWRRHEMETFSALLAICAGNSPVTGEFSTQRQVSLSFDGYFLSGPE